MTVELLGWVSNPILFLINALAVLRITRSVTTDSFPFGPLRLRIGDWANDRWPALQRVAGAGKIVHPAPSDADRRKVTAYDGVAPLAYLLICPWCVSVYVSVFVGALASTGPWWLWIATPLALSAVTGILADLTN